MKTEPAPVARTAVAGVVALIVTVGRCGPRTAPIQTARESPHDTGTTVFEDVTLAAGIRHSHSKPVLDHQLDNIMAWVCSVGAAAAAGDFDNDGWIDLYVTNSHKGTPNYLYRNNGDGTFTDVAAQAGVALANGEDGTSMDAVWGDFDNDGWKDLYLVRWGRDALFRNNGDGTFSDVTARCFRRRDGSPGTDWANGCAAIWFDYNLDGRLDLYVGNYFPDVDLWHLESTRIMHDDFEKARNGGRNFLYRQESDGTFTLDTPGRAVRDPSAAADGPPSAGPARQGFTEVAESLGVDDPGWTLAVGSADVDNDGWPDLYCADDFGPDQLFLNNRDGTFRNVSETSLGADSKKGMNVDFGDFDNDGWLDIYVANITTREYLQEGNMLWHNDGPDQNPDHQRGADQNPDGKSAASQNPDHQGGASQNPDHQGGASQNPDHQGGASQNPDHQGGASPPANVSFTDVSLETGTYDGGWGWGAKFFDYDHDGDLDLIAANGFISAGEGNYWFDLASWTVLGQDPAEARHWPTIGDRSFSGYERERLWRNDGGHLFSERAAELGIDTNRDGRGVVCFDYDNDGDLDLFIANQGQPPNLYRNNGAPNRHWLMVALEADPATGVNRDAIGTRVTLVTAAGRQIRERDGGNGYCGQSDPRLHFGLGGDDRVQLLEVRWPDGGLQYLENIPADRLITVRQNRSTYATQLAIAVGPPKPWSGGTASARTAADLPPADPEQVERFLGELEERLRQQPVTHLMDSRYRAECVAANQHDRAIRFFRKLVEDRPSDVNARLALACAYVDKIPTCGGLAAIVSKGTQANKSLEQLDRVIADQSELWIAHYARGMNHLHWPRALRHSERAAADFERCLALQRKAGRANAKSYFERTYILLGDAWAKAEKFDRARRAWRDGLAAFSGSKPLRDRLAIKDNAALLKFVESQRSLEQPIDTDLSFVDREP